MERALEPENTAQPREQQQGASRGCSHRNVTRGSGEWGQALERAADTGLKVTGTSWAGASGLCIAGSRHLPGTASSPVLPAPTLRHLSVLHLGPAGSAVAGGRGEGSLEPGAAHTPIPVPPDDGLRGLPAQGLLLPQLLQHPGPAGGQCVPHLLRHPVSGARGPARGMGQGRGSERTAREQPVCIHSSVRALGPGWGLPGGCGPKEGRGLLKITSRRGWGTLQSNPHPPGQGAVCPWRMAVACPPLERRPGPSAPGVQSLWCQSCSSRPECPLYKGVWWAATGNQAWRWGPGLKVSTRCLPRLKPRHSYSISSRP